MKKDLKDFYENAMSISDFLERYCGIIINNKKLVHDNVKYLFPNIQRSSFEELIKNPDLIYTGKVVFVKDYNNQCIPYVTGYDLEIRNQGLDDREILITELVSAICKIINSSNNSLIILENNDSISNNIIGSTSREIDIIDDEIVKLNNNGGILIKTPIDIFTFEYLISKIFSVNDACYSQNNINAFSLSKEKDIISISITNNGKVYITFNGETIELLNSMDIRNYLLKMYYPREEQELISYEENYDLELLKDYELERLIRKYYKEKKFSMFFKFKREWEKRRREYKQDTKKYREEKRKVRIKKIEEEE